MCPNISGRLSGFAAYVAAAAAADNFHLALASWDTQHGFALLAAEILVVLSFPEPAPLQPEPAFDRAAHTKPGIPLRPALIYVFGANAEHGPDEQHHGEGVEYAQFRDGGEQYQDKNQAHCCSAQLVRTVAALHPNTEFPVYVVKKIPHFQTSVALFGKSLKFLNKLKLNFLLQKV